jgi:hypothetical protein
MGVSCAFISLPTRNVTVCKQEKLVHDAHCKTKISQIKGTVDMKIITSLLRPI